MEQSPKPNHIVELDLSRIVKQMFYLTGFSFLILFVLQIAIYQAFSYTFTLLTVSLDIIIFSASYLVLIILHEFFHLLGFRIFSNVPWRNMKVGVNLKLGIAYATTPQLMTNQEIRKSLLLPFWMTGVLPAVIGLITDSTMLIALAALLIGGAAGDFSMYKQLKKLPDDWLIKDHPTEPKLYLFNPAELPKIEQLQTNQ
ncbi:DUF3267 domain-containing protein [Sporosarcina pasteurii]|uniref:Protein of uncharacterized function (DUF3267) n=1 Tax=Sporosarcina pasteurii TaxID=1474 RepID=A0A380CJX4_SPOPA|nr:DUF3267 domain-containing protein [Sporosarcina pasteurii]MDS9471845.1 DUF3267 domain-containing protein [Sporosarcina pasteurii]QBQ06584.1 DUF3267 domain-containing protein [Sporosarcina pasteurii]SUJ22019.1 Protein of uncharacterised function (DUF3267) [Sporosarcina pasteurii]